MKGITLAQIVVLVGIQDVNSSVTRSQKKKKKILLVHWALIYKPSQIFEVPLKGAPEGSAKSSSKIFSCAVSVINTKCLLSRYLRRENVPKVLFLSEVVRLIINMNCKKLLIAKVNDKIMTI